MTRAVQMSTPVIPQSWASVDSSHREPVSGRRPELLRQRVLRAHS